MDSEMNQLNAAAAALERARRVVTVSHRRPDGDTLGAALALAEALGTAGKAVACFCVDEVPAAFRFLPNAGLLTKDPSVFALADTVVILDCGDLRYTGIEPMIVSFAPKPLLLNIDHHAVNERFGDVNAIVGGAASTTEVIYNILKILKWKVTPTIATDLLVGIVTDTMLFFNPATTASSLQLAAELQRLGGDMKAVSRTISKNKNVGSLVLWGKALERLKFDSIRSRASTMIKHDEYAGLGAGDDAADGLSNFLNNTLSARTVLVLRELGEGMVKGSLRTASDEVDVCEEALRYGGGGHRKAAGFVAKGRVVEKDTEWSIEV